MVIVKRNVNTTFLFAFVGFAVLMTISGCSNDDPIVVAEIDSLNFDTIVYTYALENGIDTASLQKSESGVYYYLDSELNPSGVAAAGLVVSFYFEMRQLGGTVIADFHDSTQTQTNNGDPIKMKQGANAIYPLGLDDALAEMREGESYGIIIPPELGLGDYSYGTQIESQANLFFSLDIVNVETEEEILTDELLEINQYIISNELNDTSLVPIDFVDRLESGVVFKRLTKDTVNLQPLPLVGDSIALSYSAWFVRDSLTGPEGENDFRIRPDANPLRFEFRVTPAIPGLLLGVDSMRLGERALIMIPSYLAYQESGQVFPRALKDFYFSEGIIPEYVLEVGPYEPMVFEAQLQEIY